MNYDTAWFVGSNCFLTTSEPLQSPFAIEPFGAHPSAIAAFSPAHTNRTKRDNEL